ncbi:MAG TPA: hypothetical protein VMR06_01520 [Dokdonella sp.]|uniref:hypothetical protein n=1 Tax=Dokdonella sp. TaxID=2291710 RepID=UPI002C537E12|nr:hypothetical protein [Dokdonella sp.]HUD40655.1 hypothetical protein [Dokdonella sp.]
MFRLHGIATSISIAIGSSIALFVQPAASQALPATPRNVVGISIGTDLTVDTRFGDGGYTVVNYNDDEGTWDEAVRVIAADGGGFWLVGFHRTDAHADRVAISKLDPDGVLDPSFGVGGKLLSPTGVSMVKDAIVANGRFYVAGIHYLDTPGLGIAAVACIQFDGTACPGFGEGGTATIAVNQPGFNSGATRILHRDGSLYAIGDTDPGGPTGHSSAIAIAKLDAVTGALDASFGDGSGPLPGTKIIDPNRHPNGYDFPYAAAFAGNGKILVGGSAQNSEGPGSDGFVLAFDPATGALDSSFGSGGYAWFSFDVGVNYDQVAVRAIRVQDDGRILLAGDANHDDEFFNTITDVLLGSLQPDGTPSAGFGSNGATHINVALNGATQDLAVRANGDLVVSMASNGIVPNEYTPATQQSIVQFDASGNGPTSTVSIEYPSALTPNGYPYSMLVDSRDRILVAGFAMWDFNFPVPDSDHSVTRLVREGIFANGFEAATEAGR